LIQKRILSKIEEGEFLKFSEEFIEKVSSGKFVLHHHVFRGPIVIRRGWSSEHWDFRVDTGSPELIHFVLWNDPSKVKKTTAEIKPCKDKKVMNLEFLPPKGRVSYSEWKRRSIPFRTPLNPSRATPAFLIIEDKGTCEVIQDDDIFKKFNVHGKRMKGLFIAYRESDSSKLWTFERVEEPKVKNLPEIEFSAEVFEHA